MDYLFENLGDERFQELCSTLIAKEFPDTQSFPVGQPDGGRDSIAYKMEVAKKSFFVFQVKYVRNPNLITDVQKWFTEIIADEAPKINKLIPGGALKYYIITNVKGSAHLNNGSIDKVNKILEDNILIPSLCWWRDDLNRLFEKDILFKWSFPEILNGQDILNSILFSHINENKERREAIVRAYLVDQYDIDNEVKFRQIDLQNKLFDLFTDVPISIKKYNEKNLALKSVFEVFEGALKNSTNHQNDLNFPEDTESIGAARFLLHPLVQNKVERILLEGGPGQGKSTISQYICQVHRARLLNRYDDIKLIPENVLQTPIRLPFKIDLRHIALWVDSKNPYLSRLNEERFMQIHRQSLESFLIGHVLYHSQIDTFNADDLLAILKNSSVLFVFDGFDEIADIEVRRLVIDLINKGINRIKENSKSIQIVITSRPAAFSESIGFSVDEYPHFQLCDITQKTINEYVIKWIRASRLENRESIEIKQLVEDKLKLPHLRDLAKSPMQLAIFISLLRTRGESLPNKRTALYDSYIELFFNRESEKNSTIRDHRDLIIDIHQYIAWILHSEAELYGNSGSIEIDVLKQRLKKYLIKEGHKTDIADQLFHVLQERVCALVSRVQGTYEFEVQPLREYFCAKYLYKTSPYSPVGKEKAGTKPERFNAISKSNYWNNVVRFFSGCFDKGELPMLIQELKELMNDEFLKFTSYPSLITSQLLSDWVFTQYPVLMKDVVKIVVEGINRGNIINQDFRFSNNEVILIPCECGRNEIIDECFTQLKKFPNKDYSNELIGILSNNPHKLDELWKNEVDNFSNNELVKWLEYGYQLHVIQKLDPQLLTDLVTRDSIEYQEKKLQILINTNRFDIVENNIILKKTVLDYVLSNKILTAPRRKSECSIQYISSILNPYIISTILLSENNDIITFKKYIYQRYRYFLTETDSMEFEIKDELDLKISEVICELKVVFESSINEWKTSIHYWDLLVESFRSNFGDYWALKTISILSAGINSREEKFDDFSDLFDSSVSMCKRVRYARLKSGNSVYWERQLLNSEDLVFTLTILLTWSTPKTLINIFEQINNEVLKLRRDELLLLIKTLKQTSLVSHYSLAQSKEIFEFLKNKENFEIMKYLFSLRSAEKNRIDFIYSSIKNIPEPIFDEIVEIKYEYLVKKFIDEGNDFLILEEIKKYYTQMPFSNFNAIYYSSYYLENVTPMPLDLARKIMESSILYPRLIVSLAEKSCRQFANKNVKAVGRIAEVEKWFD